MNPRKRLWDIAVEIDTNYNRSSPSSESSERKTTGRRILKTRQTYTRSSPRANDKLKCRSSSVSSSSSNKTSSKYIIQDEELPEDESLLEILGESEPDPEDKDTLPVRFLDDFDFYEYNSRNLCVLPLDVDPEIDNVFYGASGMVRPRLLAEDDEVDSNNSEDDESVRVKLSAIREVWTDGVEIWVMTTHAWYLLELPSRRYAAYFKEMTKLAEESPIKTLSRSSQPNRQSTPFVTPRIGSIAQGLFVRSLLILKGLDVDNAELMKHQNVCVPEIPFVVHKTGSTNIKWGKRIPGTGSEKFYESVFLDEVEYHIGDCVAVSAPSMNDSEDSDGSVPDSLSKTAWFAQICYFRDSAKNINGKRTVSERMFHCRWFSHGSQTILAETANPQALFLLDQCDDNPVDCILQKIRVRHLGVGTLEPVIISDMDVGSDSFHLTYKWDADKFTLSAVDFEAEKTACTSTGVASGQQPSYRQCYVCNINARVEVMRHCNKLTQGVLEISGVGYHVYDFVYVKEGNALGLLAVAQITDLLQSSGKDDIKVSMFSRSSYDSSGTEGPQAQRTISPTGQVKTISAECLDGKCFVLRDTKIKNMAEWLDEPDNFIVNGSARLKQCKDCSAAHGAKLEAEELVKKGKKLLALDLFSGAGGLTIGMDQSGFIETRWAVEMSPSAALSLKTNYKNVTVYNQDCNVLLKHAADIQAGKKPSTIFSLGSKKEALPPLPAPGEVDLIMGGPPCQPFSGMNRHKRVDDIRQTCIPTMLSFVEFYNPQYVLIENVTGLLHFRLKGKQEGNRIVGGIEAGMVKFIMRAFTSLGYQCQLRVLNSADYGSPQQRNRVIFWGARLDLALPKWPTPTHIPRNGHNSAIRCISDIGYAPVASRNIFEEGHQHAPFHSVTVNEAIDDLPPWDWENPAIIIPVPREAKKPKPSKRTFLADTTKWRMDTDEAFDVSGFAYPVSYATLPRNLYQASCRRGLSDFARVEYHYTQLFSAGVVERTVNIPIRPLANYRDLPLPLRTAISVKGKEKGTVVTKDKYWRLEGDGQFRTMMTKLNPASKGAFVIHPTDKRVLTVREVTRAQGFPDEYDFCSESDRTNQQVLDYYRQIGNAVPVHLAYALGRALGEGIVEAEMNRRRDEEEDTFMDEESVNENQRRLNDPCEDKDEDEDIDIDDDTMAGLNWHRTREISEEL